MANDIVMTKIELAQAAMVKDPDKNDRLKPTTASLYLICVAGMWADTLDAKIDDDVVKLTGLMADFYSTGCRASRQARGIMIKEEEKKKRK